MVAGMARAKMLVMRMRPTEAASGPELDCDPELMPVGADEVDEAEVPPPPQPLRIAKRVMLKRMEELALVIAKNFTMPPRCPLFGGFLVTSLK